MLKYEEFKDIIEYSNWDIIRRIRKGWSQDNKYYIKSKNGEEYLLRVSDISEFDSKLKEYEKLCIISKININMSMPVSFGVCSNSTSVYSLLTWINGKDAEVVLPNFSEKKQYELGEESGKILKSIHSIPAPKNQQIWSGRFNNKIEVIDFNRYDFGDPWEEFNRIVFSVHVSIPFVLGQINGYFNNSVPDKFFKLMALYVSAFS